MSDKDRQTQPGRHSGSSPAPGKGGDLRAHQTGDFIDGYRLLQMLGEGGMGEVWLAEQLEPIRRRVALKIIKQGMDTRQVVARFESERQALAVMDHPNIARVFAAGATERGRPYFVMEYVQGVAITEYCDQHKLPTRARLLLFLSVCEGVQHAHRNAIIHRDIKPQNVLVTVQDNRAVPKIIDFGIAKATDQRLTEQTVFTELGQLIGTPEYMSPEQAEMSGLNIDTRTDIYSLGVLLYELLVGVLPFDPRQLRRAGFDEIRRRIREEDPPRPSTRLTTLDVDTDLMAAARGTSSTKLVSQLQGDLDWITLKALDKDRTRRYGSPAELADDIQRHLRHEPVLASPPSTLYRVRKFVRRHKMGVSFAAAIFLMISTLAVTMSIQARRIGRERDRANAQAMLAAEETETARQVSDFLVDLFKVSDPGESRGNSITAREILDQGALRIQKELADQPRVQATMLRTMGRVYAELGLYEEAGSLLRRALEISERIRDVDELGLAGSLDELASLYTRLDRDAEAEPLARQALAIHERLQGADHPDAAISLNSLGIALQHLDRLDEAQEVHERALQIREQALDPNHQRLAATIHNLAIVHYFQNDYPEAERLYRRSAEIEARAKGTENHQYATSLHTLAILCQDQGRLTEALELEQESLAIRERVLGPDHYHVALSLTTLGNIYRALERTEEAEAPLRRALAIAEKSIGPDHGETQWMRRSLARALIALNKDREAEELLLTSIRALEATESEDDLPLHLNALGLIQQRRGKLDEAEATYRRSVDIVRRAGDEADPWLGLGLAGLANVYRDKQDYAAAESAFREAVAIMESAWGPQDHDRLTALVDYAEMLRRAGRPEEAAVLVAQVDSLSR